MRCRRSLAQGMLLTIFGGEKGWKIKLQIKNQKSKIKTYKNSEQKNRKTKTSKLKERNTKNQKSKIKA